MRTNLSTQLKTKIKTILIGLLGIICVTHSFAQTPEALIGKTDVLPVVDGTIDEVWTHAQQNNIALPYGLETPTLGETGQTWWKGFWSDKGLYFLVNVTDDVFYPAYAGTDYTMHWMYDKVELYIDANYIQKDGMGPAHGKGHYNYAPAIIESMINIGLASSIMPSGSIYSYKMYGSSYVAEFFIPFSELTDKDGYPLDKSEPFGFDVTVIDNDVKSPVRNRMVWANSGRIDESWNNMDDAGLIVLENGPCTGPPAIEKITLNPGSITTNMGTLQLLPILEPALAGSAGIQWSVINGTGIASISQTGLVTALSNGTVTIKAVSKDDPTIEASTTVTISGQAGSAKDPWRSYNLIRNWDFISSFTQWDGWYDSGVPEQQTPVIENGAVKMTTGYAPDGNYWHYMIYQTGLQAEPNVPYLLKFKAWSSVPKLNRVDFEDTPDNGYARYGSSTDAEAINGRSEWQYNTTTEPQWFTFHVTFDELKPNTQQKIQWMLSSAGAINYLDSILLMKEGDTTVVTQHYLTLSTNQINVAAGEVSTMMDIYSDVSWTASVDQPWLKISSFAGTGSTTLTLTAQANTLTNARSANITIKAEGLATKTIMVTQLEQPLPTGENGQPTYGEKWGNEVWNDQNLIKNWNFNDDLANWSWWVDGNGAGPTLPVITNGVAVMNTQKSVDGTNWHYLVNQTGLNAEANVPYILKFKSWSTAPRSNGVTFEDRPENNFNQYGASQDAEAINGRSNWTYYTTSEPRWYTFHVVFDQIKPTTVQKIQWMLSTADATTYLDSVILIKEGDSIIATDPYLILSKNNIFLDDKVANATLTISSNTNWEIHSDQGWLYSDRYQGTGNHTITLAALDNIWYTNRTATITVDVIGQAAQTISVIQKARQAAPVGPGDDDPAEYWSSEAWNDYNLIKNWNFSSDLTNWDYWVDTALEGQSFPAVKGGILSMNTATSLDGSSWHYMVMQRGLQAEPNVPYTLKFKSWSSAPRSNVVIFEDSYLTNYNRYGASSDAESINGRSEWIYFSSSEPTWHTFHVVFDQMTSSTQQKIQWMLSTAGATSYLDSIILIKDSDLLKIKEAQLALSASHIDVNYTEAQATVEVSSNTNSLAISDQDWLTVYPSLVTGSKKIAIEAQANNTNKARTATVTLYPAGLPSKTITVTQNFTTGITALSAGQKLKVFPNPTTGEVKLTLDQAPEKGTFLSVYDLTGKLILRQPIDSKEQWIDLKGNPVGVYFISINLKDYPVQKVILK